MHQSSSLCKCNSLDDKSLSIALETGQKLECLSVMFSSGLSQVRGNKYP